MTMNSRSSTLSPLRAAAPGHVSRSRGEQRSPHPWQNPEASAGTRGPPVDGVPIGGKVRRVGPGSRVEAVDQVIVGEIILKAA